MIKVKKFIKLKGDKKKYAIIFEKNGKEYTRKFGAAGMSDFTIHKDIKRRERYISRHQKDLRTGDPMKPGYLSMYILWNKPSIKDSLTDYKRRLSVYNKTGKFPTAISGSKKLSFGTTNIPFEETSLKILPPDIQSYIRDVTGARIIQDRAKKYNPTQSLIDALKIRGYKRYQDAAKRTSKPSENLKFINELWTNLDPVNDFTSKWLTRAAKVLTKKDFDFKTRNFWWRVIQNQIAVMSEIEEAGDPSEELKPHEYIHYDKSQEAIMLILNKVGYRITEEDIDEGWADDALMWWKSKKSNTFGKKNTLFGMKKTDEIKDILADKVRWDPAQLILEHASAPQLQKLARGYLTRKFVKSKKYLKMILLAINIDHFKRKKVSNPDQKALQQMEPDSGTPWEALDPKRYETAFFLNKCLTVLKPSDKDDMLWYNCIYYILLKIEELDPEFNRYPGDQMDNIRSCEDSIIQLLPMFTDPPVYPDLDKSRWYSRAIIQIEENEENEGNAFGKKTSKLPNNVINKKLYSSIKEKIKKSIKGRRWGAYDSGRLVREYKAAGGKYTGSKTKNDLTRWYKEKWVDACAWPKRKPCGRKTKSSIAYCRPSIKIDSKTPKLVQNLTKAQIKSRCARKKRNPMKRIMKFGKATPDINIGNGWVIHCNVIPGIGPHATIRRKDISGPTPQTDHAFRYGIKNPGGSPVFWASGELARSGTGLPNPEYQKLLMDHFYNYCGGYNPRILPPKSPAHYSRFGSVKKIRQDMYNEIFTGEPFDTTMRRVLYTRCANALSPKLSDDICAKRMSELLISIYYTLIEDKKLNKIQLEIKKEIDKYKNIYKTFPTKIKLNRKASLTEFLVALQGGYFLNYKDGRLASLIWEHLHRKSA